MMKKKEIDQFLDTHRYRRFSAAELMYTSIKDPEWLKKRLQKILDNPSVIKTPVVRNGKQSMKNS